VQHVASPCPAGLASVGLASILPGVGHISVHARIATGSRAGRMVNRDKTGMVKGV
jgi:xanthosine utilization system XapX-like protein